MNFSDQLTHPVFRAVGEEADLEHFRHKGEQRHDGQDDRGHHDEPRGSVP